MQRIFLSVFASRKFRVEAAPVPCMAGCADLQDLCEHRIPVAVDRERFYILKMSRSLPLDP